MADLVHLSQSSGVTPQLGGHYATKGYVDASTGRGAPTTRTASYTITANDAGSAQVYSSTSAGTFTLPTNASAAIAVGAVIPFRQAGTGQLTIAGASGVTLRSRGNAFKLAGQYAMAEALKVATDEWWLYGDVTP